MHLAFFFAAIIAFSKVDSNQKKAVWPKPTKTLVELSCGGDDNLTRGVCIAIEHSLSSSAEFEWNTEEKKGALLVVIPTNVRWKELNQRTRAFYQVIFRSNDDDKTISKHRGSCWEDEIAVCGQQIVNEAIKIRRKLSRRN